MEKIRQNIFGIGEIYELQREGQWVERNRESYREYGYFGGGRAPSPVSTTVVERVDYSNDTVTSNSKNTLIFAERQAGAVGNSDFGYWGAGSPARSTVQRVDYSNETASVRANLNYATSFGRMAIGNNNFAYWGGAYSTSPTIYRTQLDRIEYSNDLVSPTLRGFLPTLTRMSPGSLSRNNDFGYYASGLATGPGASLTVARLPYANDTITMLYRGNLVVARRLVGQGTGNSNFGYIAGTNIASPGSNVDRVDYANDLATSSSRGNLNTPVIVVSAAGNSNFGYFGGGSLTSVVQRIDYSNDNVTASIRGPLSSAKYEVTATSSASFGGSPVSYLGAPWVATAPFGYFGAGTDFGSPRTIYSSVFRIDYQNDTQTTVTRGPLASSAQSMGGTGNSNFGYFIAGINSTIIERIDYSNDSTVSSRVGDSTVSSSVQACGNKNFGYYANFGNAAMRKIDYSNDSIDTVVLGDRLFAFYSAAGNSNFGYFSGFGSSLDRIDYSNDLSSPLIRGSLSISRSQFAATGNNSYGWFGGGVPYSTIDRIDFSNDTGVASTRGPLTINRTYPAATTNARNS